MVLSLSSRVPFVVQRAQHLLAYHELIGISLREELPRAVPRRLTLLLHNCVRHVPKDIKDHLYILPQCAVFRVVLAHFRRAVALVIEVAQHFVAVVPR